MTPNVRRPPFQHARQLDGEAPIAAGRDRTSAQVTWFSRRRRCSPCPREAAWCGGRRSRPLRTSGAPPLRRRALRAPNRAVVARHDVAAQKSRAIMILLARLPTALARSCARGGNLREEARGFARDLGGTAPSPLRVSLSRDRRDERAIGIAQDQNGCARTTPGYRRNQWRCPRAVGLVEDDGVVVGKHGARVRPAERRIREQI